MINALKSRTNWVIILSVALTALQMAEPFIEPQLFVLIQTVLGALGVYFRTFPKQTPE